MTQSKNWFASMFSSDPGPEDLISSSTMNVTKIVGIFVIVTGVVAQVLEGLEGTGTGTDALRPETLTIWLGVAFLVVAITITDMICRAYTTAHAQAFSEKSFKEPIRVDIVADGKGIRSAEWRGWVDEPGAVLARIRYTDDQTDTWVPLAQIREHP